jgi:hypothetical protein
MRGLGSRPPEKGCVASWSLVKLAGGKSLDAWLAGPYVGVYVHCQRYPKPCLKMYCGPNTACVGCEEKLRIEWRAYLPFYATDACIPTVAALSRDAVAALDKAKLHDQVKIGRGPRDKDALWVAPILAPRRFDTTLKERQVGQDICDWLPVMFKMRDVITGDNIRHGVLGEEPRVVTDPANELDVETLVVRGAIGLAGGEQPAAISREARNEYFVRMNGRGKNGKAEHS